MNAHANRDLRVFLIVGLVLLLLAMPPAHEQNSETASAEAEFVSFSESGTVEFLNSENEAPLLEALSPAKLGIETEETQLGYKIKNVNDKFVLSIFYTPNGPFSRIIAPDEVIEIPTKDFRLGMAIPNQKAIVGNPEEGWVFRI